MKKHLNFPLYYVADVPLWEETAYIKRTSEKRFVQVLKDGKRLKWTWEFSSGRKLTGDEVFTTTKKEAEKRLEELRGSKTEVEPIETALRKLLDRYVELVNSGDAGDWNPEEETVVIDSRSALESMRQKRAERDLAKFLQRFTSST